MCRSKFPRIDVHRAVIDKRAWRLVVTRMLSGSIDFLSFLVEHRISRLYILIALDIPTGPSCSEISRICPSYALRSTQNAEHEIDSPNPP